MKQDKTGSTLRLISLFLERAATVALAILLLRLHCRMASIKNNTFENQLHFLQQWIREERKFTLITIVALLVAFVLSVIDELYQYWSIYQ